MMPFWYIGSLAVLIADAAVSRDPLVVAAAALLAARFLLLAIRARLPAVSAGEGAQIAAGEARFG